MSTIFDFINAKEKAAYYTEAVSKNIPMLGETLFPSQTQLGLELSWNKAAGGLPVALTPSAFDTKATLRDRLTFGKLITEMPFFRESMRVGEKERQQLIMLLNGNNSEAIKPIIAKIYDDAKNLVDGASVQFERMRMQLLYTGKIAIKDRNAPYDLDYKLKAAQKTTITDTAKKWAQTETATPISDIIGWQDDMEDATGVRPTRAICTRKTWGYLLTNKQIRMDISATGTIVVTDAILKSYLMDKIGLSIQVYNKKFALTVGGASQPFFPDDVFTLIPEGSLGTSWYGTTPEEADLMSGNNAAQVQIVNTGVAITTYQEVHPVNTVTVVSAIMLPSFEQGDKIFIATVNS